MKDELQAALDLLETDSKNSNLTKEARAVLVYDDLHEKNLVPLCSFVSDQVQVVIDYANKIGQEETKGIKIKVSK